MTRAKQIAAEIRRYERNGWEQYIPARELWPDDREYLSALRRKFAQLRTVLGFPSKQKRARMTAPFTNDIQRFLEHTLRDGIFEIHDSGGWTSNDQPDVAALLDLVYPDWQDYLDSLALKDENKAQATNTEQWGVSYGDLHPEPVVAPNEADARRWVMLALHGGRTATLMSRVVTTGAWRMRNVDEA